MTAISLLFLSFALLNSSLSENQYLYFLINTTIPSYRYFVILQGPSTFYYSGNGSGLYIGKINITNDNFGVYSVYLNISGISYEIYGGQLTILPRMGISINRCGAVFLYSNENYFNISIEDSGNTPLSIYVSKINSSAISLLHPGESILQKIPRSIKNITVYYSFENITRYEECSFSYSSSFQLKIINTYNIQNSSGNYYIFYVFYNGTIPTFLNFTGYIYSDGQYFTYIHTFIINSTGNYTLKLPTQLSFAKYTFSYTNSSGQEVSYNYVQSQSSNQLVPQINNGLLYYIIILLVLIVLIFVLHRLLWRKR